MLSYTEDKFYGLNNEIKYLNILSNYFKTTFKKYDSDYSLLDFYSPDKKYLEMKSRRINHNQYPTAILNTHKIEEFNNRININNDSKLYIVYIYLDGIYYIEYNKEIFNKFETKNFKRNERNGIVDTLNFCYFIPTNLLIKID
jgi:hypothetical protein